MPLVRKNAQRDRTVRCKGCGQYGKHGETGALYWYVDTDNHNRFVLADAYGNPHRPVCSNPVKGSHRPGDNPRDAWNDTNVTVMPPDAVNVDDTPQNSVNVDSIDLTAIEARLRLEIEAKIHQEYANQIAILENHVNQAISDARLPVTVKVHDSATGATKDLGITHQVMPKVLRYMLTGVKVWLKGPAGTGKSTIAADCAKALSVDCVVVSLTARMPESKITGFIDANGTCHGTEFENAWKSGGVILFDECDNGDPNSLLVVSNALSNGKMTFASGTYDRHPSCYVLAAGNTYGTGPDGIYAGRNQLDGAFLDRFATIHVPVDEALEDYAALSLISDQDAGKRYIATVREIRANADRLIASGVKLKVTISPRASIDGCRLLNGGEPVSEVIDACVRKSITAQDWNRITEGMVL